MTNMTEAAKKQVSELIEKAYRRAAEMGVLPAGIELKGTVEIPKDTANGDWAASCAMAAARDMRLPPRKIADALLENLELEGSYFSKAEVAGPGFLNFRLGDRWFSELIAGIERDGGDYGRGDSLSGQKIMVEFVSANPTGPMHMGNARGGVLGDALAEILSREGAEVSREFYVNDAGNQIEKFAKSIDARYRQLILGYKGACREVSLRERRRIPRQTGGGASLCDGCLRPFAEPAANEGGPQPLRDRV